jgi:hypothetical protein
MTETNTSQGVGKYLIGREATAYGGLVQRLRQRSATKGALTVALCWANSFKL